MKWPAFDSKRCLLGLAAVALTFGLARAVASSLLESIDREVSSLYEKSRDSIVKVHAVRERRGTILPLPPSHRVGTGFFIDAEGRLVTTATVVDGAEKSWIEWRNRQVPARVLGADPLTNLAVLQIQPDDDGPIETPALSLGNSDEVKIGSMLIAIGFAYDLPSSPSVGFVSGLDIRHGSHVFVTSHLRASCKLSPGQGGGPVFNARGEVVGMAVAALADDQCYALPINAARKIWADIIRHGRPQYCWVGLSIGERPVPSQPPAPGQQRAARAGWQVVVQQVLSNSPAAHAGFRDGDVLVRILTNEVRRVSDVLNTMFMVQSGDELSLTLERDGKTLGITMKAGPRPPDEPLLAAPALPGGMTAPVSDQR
jgi:serine protease Do